MNWLEAYWVVGLSGGRYVKRERERLAAVGVGRRQKEQQPLWKDGVQGLWVASLPASQWEWTRENAMVARLTA